MGCLFIDNDTFEALNLTIEGPDPATGNKMWGVLNSSIGRESSAPVLWFSRYSNLEAGTQYDFKVTFTTGGQTCVIHLRLTGGMIYSTLESGLDLGSHSVEVGGSWYTLPSGNRFASVSWSPNLDEANFYYDVRFRIGPLLAGQRDVVTYASPTKVLLFDGDHTWVMADPDYCDRILGGGPGYYCKFKEGKAAPPEGRKLEDAGGTGDMRKVSGIAAEGGRYFPPFLAIPAIPAQAWVSYLINGVCHQITNRVLLPTGKHVGQASGSGWSYLAFGRYGSSVPVALLAGFNPGFVASVQVAALLDLLAMAARHDIPAPHSMANAEGLAASRILKLLDDAAPPSPNTLVQADAAQALSHAHRHSTAEQRIELDWLLRDFDSSKRTDVAEIFEQLHLPGPEHAEALVEACMNRQSPPALPARSRVADVQPTDVDAFAAEMNRRFSGPAAQVAAVIGASDFREIFGFAPDGGCALVDPNILRRAAAAHHSPLPS